MFVSLTDMCIATLPKEITHRKNDWLQKFFLKLKLEVEFSLPSPPHQFPVEAIRGVDVC